MMQACRLDKLELISMLLVMLGRAWRAFPALIMDYDPGPIELSRMAVDLGRKAGIKGGEMAVVDIMEAAGTLG
jgi:hypothetical protein